MKLGQVCVLVVVAACAEPKAPEVPPLTVAKPPVTIQQELQPRGTKLMTRKSDVVDTLHGVRVADPYRWLEDSDSEEVKKWTEAQNAQTRAKLDAIPGREKLKKEVTDLLQIGTVGAPTIRSGKTGVHYFHQKREGAQNQPSLYVRDGHAAKDRVLIDVAALSADGTTALDWWYPSWDGALLAWGKSESGSEESVLHVRDVATGKDLPDRIDRTRHASVAWLPDGKSFYYSRYPEPGSVPAGEEKYHAKIFLHVLGQDPKNDKLVFGDGRDKTDIPQVVISPNGRWLVVRVHMGWDKSDVFVKDLQQVTGVAFKPVAKGVPALFEPSPENDRLYLMTNDGAPRYRLFEIDYAKLEREHWKELVPEGKDVLTSFDVLKSEIVATYLHDASSRVERFGRDGKSKGAIALPAIGSASTSGISTSDEVFVNFTSYTTPAQVLRADLHAGPALAMWDRAGALKDDDGTLVSGSRGSAEGGTRDVEIQQMFATSKDGTKVPMFVISKRGLKKTGKNPTVLYGYGGFNVNQTPAFSSRALASVRRGAVWATAILRGGGELGEDWHKGGMLEKKQNVFDDLYACADQLFKAQIASPETLGVVGGSNGGLLVATAVTQRPELFRVGLSLVPLTDMVRYHRFRIAKLWIPEYGDPDKAEPFKFLYAYSPYHHVENGTKYPSMLFTTAESDSRVDPMHARKMAARMQEAQGDPDHPILLRVETKAGHGAGKPVTKLADELTDELSFLLTELGIPLERP
jgi:prolyl oligopeptidase